MTNTQQLRMDLPSTSKFDTVEDYQFEPIKGYPMLHWKGKRPFNSTQYYPAQRKEVYGEEINSWINKIYWGDNLQVMSHLLKEYRGEVDLVYIDPPFDSGADYKKRIELKGESLTNNHSTFEEKQYADLWINDEYLQFIYERLILTRELLSEGGSIYLHCDWHKNNYLRLILDEVFGVNNIINEIIWHYKTFQGQVKSYFARKHDTLLLYKKSSKFTFNQLFDTPLEDTIDVKRWKNYIDDKGRIYGRNMPSHDSRFIRYLNKWKKEHKREPNADDIVYEIKGQPLDSVWHIKGLDPKSMEKVDYPTQKPESLLKLVIEASSNPGDLVFDCFMGSGTTQTVAMKLGRKFIGADINLGAIQITTKRLLGVAQELNEQQQQGQLEVEKEELTTYYTGFEVYNVNHYDIFRNPVQAKDLLIEALEINPIERNNLFDGEKDGRMIKIMPVNRIATRADLSELITGFDYKAFEKSYAEHSNKAVEKITLVCMGHEPDLAAQLQNQVKPFHIDVEVVDILRDKSNLEFKRDSEAVIDVKKNHLVIDKFYPMNLLQKLSLQQENVEDWREMVESVMIDWNYDGAVLEPQTVDIPGKNELVEGKYKIPEDAGTIRLKITDLLSESVELEVQNG